MACLLTLSNMSNRSTILLPEAIKYFIRTELKVKKMMQVEIDVYETEKYEQYLYSFGLSFYEDGFFRGNEDSYVHIEEYIIYHLTYSTKYNRIYLNNKHLLDIHPLKRPEEFPPTINLEYVKRVNHV